MTTEDKFLDLSRCNPKGGTGADLEGILLRNHETLERARLARMTDAMKNPHDVFAKDEHDGLADKIKSEEDDAK